MSKKRQQIIISTADNDLYGEENTKRFESAIAGAEMACDETLITGVGKTSKAMLSTKKETAMVKLLTIKTEEKQLINDDAVEKLVFSIKEVGLLNPILLTPDLKLIAGRQRLEAYKKLELKEIPASIINLNELRQRLAAIDENLIRKTLTALEEAEQLAERKKIYEELYPETRRGTAGALARHNGATDKISFATDVANKTGQSVRNVNRKVAIYDGLLREVVELVRDSPIADNFSELEELKSYPLDTQIRYAEFINAGKAKNIAQARRVSNAESSFANTDIGKFLKTVKTAKKAINQIIDSGVIEHLVKSPRGWSGSYEGYRSFVDDGLNALVELQATLKQAIDIYEKGIEKVKQEKFPKQACNKELALEK